MEEAHGTTRLITDYGALDHARCAMKHYDEALQALASEDSSLIRNADDYDDWDYGTEPIPGDPTWIKKPNS
jgi:hypothetical protein